MVQSVLPAGETIRKLFCDPAGEVLKRSPAVHPCQNELLDLTLFIQLRHVAGVQFVKYLRRERHAKKGGLLKMSLDLGLIPVVKHAGFPAPNVVLADQMGCESDA